MLIKATKSLGEIINRSELNQASKGKGSFSNLRFLMDWSIKETSPPFLALMDSYGFFSDIFCGL